MSRKKRQRSGKKSNNFFASDPGTGVRRERGNNAIAFSIAAKADENARIAASIAAFARFFHQPAQRAITCSARQWAVSQLIPKMERFDCDLPVCPP